MAKNRRTLFIYGQRLRTDTTAVETNSHHPSDSSLLADSLRVLTRSLRRIQQGCQQGGFKVIDHARAAKYRVLEIARAARLLNEAGRVRLKKSYGRLLALTRGVALQAQRVLGRLSRGELRARADAFVQVQAQEAALRHYLPLVGIGFSRRRARGFSRITGITPRRS